MGETTFTFNIKAIADMKDVTSNIQNIQNALKQLKLPNDLQNSFKKTFGDLEKELEKYQKLKAGGFKTNSDATALEKSGKNIVRLYSEIVDKLNSLDGSQLKKAFEELGGKEVEKLKNNLTDLQNQLKQQVSTQNFINVNETKQGLQSLKKEITGLSGEAEKALSTLSNSTFNTFAKNLQDGRLDLAANNLEKIHQQVEKINNEDLTKWYNELKKSFDALSNDPGLKNTVQDVEKLKSALNTAKANAIAKLMQDFDGSAKSAEELLQKIRELTTADADFGRAQAQTNKELEQVKSRIQYFFGLNNAINLVKRAIRSAFNTIKQLDKAMTETAVVTDFDVGDMWAQLPEYTKRANELGVTTLAAYQAATLYYQQGLKTNEVNALSVETLKMARIAGLEAAEATDRMTNALRGFNMALTEANAQRVDDVYSELAANTASNVDEISTAMTKVASLAHNANMEFETTAAFLAQIIETTRESAETAGTALKTVVARFSEVKKLVGEGELRGTDEEGQAIDVNKVGAALRTAGIDLNKYFLGEAGLDDIFMELASKWDTLTSVQQRYIATQAAGSRQQSRFIAMMQDYARTQELVGKAYNANGAAARQFEKTQESLESKLNRLKNAWNEFLMGLTNNVVVKTFVDLLTDLLNILNQLTGALGQVGGAFAKWGLVIAGIAGGKALFKSAGFDSLLSIFTGKDAEGKIVKGFGKTLGNAFKKIGKSIKSGGIAKAVGGFLTKKGLSEASAGLIGIGAQLAAIAAIITVIVLAVKRLKKIYDTHTFAGQIKQSEKETERLKDASEETAEAVADLTNRYENLKSVQDTLSNATKYTLEWKEALAEANKQIQDLVDTYPELSDSLEYTYDNGNLVLKIDENQVEDAIEKATKASNLFNVAAALNNSSTASLRIQAYKNVAGTAAMQSGLRESADELQARSEDAKTFIGRMWYAYVASQAQQGLYNNAPGLGLANVINNGADWETANQAAYGNLSPTTVKYTTDLLETSYERAIRDAIIQTASDNILEHEYGDAFARAFARSYDSSEYTSTVNSIAQDLSGLSNFELRGVYTAKFGIAPSEEIAGDDATLRQRIAELQAARDLQDQLEVNFKTITSHSWGAIADLISGDVATDLNKVTEILDNLDDTELSQLQAAFGITDEELDELINNLDNFENVYDHSFRGYLQYLKVINKTAKSEFKKQAIAIFKQAGITDLNTLQNLFDQLTIQEFEQLTSIAEKLEGYSKEFSSTIMNSVADVMLEGDWENSALADFISGISSNPVLTLEAITKAAEEGQGEVQELAKDLQSLAEEDELHFGITAQVQYYFASDEYTELSEKIADLTKESGKLSAANITELAKESKTLAALLKQTEINARGLAVAMDAIEAGSITFQDLDENIVKCLSHYITLDELIQEAKDWRENFPNFEDYGEALDFITSKYKEFREMVDEYEVGNPALVQGIQEFIKFGQTAPETQKQWSDFLDIFNTFFVENQGQDFWSGIMGWKETHDGYFDSSVINDIQGYSDLIKVMQETWAKDAKNNPYGTQMSEGFAKQLIENLLAHDEGQKNAKLLAEREAENFFNEYYKGLEGVTPSQEQLIAIAEKWGLSPQQLWDELKAKNPEKWSNIDYGDLNVKVQLPTLKEILEKNGTGQSDPTAENLSAYLKELGTDNGIFDLGTVYAKIRKIVPELEKGSDEEVTEYLNSLISEAGGEVTLPITVTTNAQMKDGTWIQTIASDASAAVTSLEQYKELASTVQSSVDTDILGESLESPIKNAQELLNAFNQSLGELKADIDITGPEGKIQTLQDEITALGNLKPQVAVTPYLTASTLSIAGENGSFATLHISLAHTGGIVSSYAQGSEGYSIKPGLALTGELGPEIVWNGEKGYAYIAGKHGPEFNNLEPGDRIFNAKETQGILKRNKDISFNSLSHGGKIKSYGFTFKPKDKTGGSRDSGGSGGSDSKDSKKESTWRNELDWLYDLMEDIAEEERQQSIIQAKYDLTLKDLSKTGHDLYKLTRDELSSLQTQLNAQNTAYLKRLQQMGELQTLVNAKGYSQYLKWNQKDQTLEINWDKIEAIRDKDRYDEVTDFISRMEKVQGQMDDAQDAILDIKAQIQELQERYLQQYLDFQQKVLDAVVKQYQDTIDNLSELNDTLNDTNASILESIQKEVDLQRQIRDNTDTEQDLAELESRLAYLQRDTTGANAVEIRTLQQQLDEARNDYSDTLIDQAIDRLGEANDTAAQQREKQIELMQSQLDYWQESGALWGEVADLMATGFGSNGTIVQGSELWDVLKNADSWDGLSEAQKKNWANELILEANEVGAHLIQMNNGLGVDADLVRQSIADTNGILTRDISVKLEQVRAILAKTGSLGGTPAHSYTAEKVEGYASGGTATSTAMALLHGTPQEPEYVLNARQTDAFLRLADVLPAALGNANTIGGSYNGSATFNVEVNVGSISNDYDVDSLVARIKNDLYDAASYRNGNVLGFLR